MILATTDGCGAAKIMRRSGKSKSVVWNWQARFIAEGVDGLARDRTRKPGKAPLPTGTVQRFVAPQASTAFLTKRLLRDFNGPAGALHPSVFLWKTNSAFSSSERVFA